MKTPCDYRNRYGKSRTCRHGVCSYGRRLRYRREGARRNGNPMLVRAMEFELRRHQEGATR